MSATSESGLFAVCGSFIGLSTFAVGVRFYGRVHQGLPLGVDDWTTLAGVITYIGGCACGIEFVVLKAYGYDTASLTPAQVKAVAETWSQISIAYDFLVMTTLACAKLSALFMYRRIFSINRRLDCVILATAVIVGLWYVAFSFLSCYQCRTHFSALWDGNFKKYCTLNLAWANGLAVSDFVLDLWILLLPIPSIWSLHTTTSKKLEITGIFLLAFVGLGASIARIVFYFRGNAPGRKLIFSSLLESGRGAGRLRGAESLDSEVA